MQCQLINLLNQVSVSTAKIMSAKLKKCMTVHALVLSASKSPESRLLELRSLFLVLWFSSRFPYNLTSYMQTISENPKITNIYQCRFK